MIAQNKITGIEYDLSSPKRALHNSIYGVLVYGESADDNTPHILFMWGNDDEVEFVDVTNDYELSIDVTSNRASIIKEYILSAANYYNDNIIHDHQPTNINIGFVVCGRRHYNCSNTFVQIAKVPYDNYWNNIHNTEVQGFITNTNRFVNRQEAYKIAYESNQIIGPNKGCPTNYIGLTSEDLY